MTVNRPRKVPRDPDKVLPAREPWHTKEDPCKHDDCSFHLEGMYLVATCVDCGKRFSSEDDND